MLMIRWTEWVQTDARRLRIAMEHEVKCVAMMMLEFAVRRGNMSHER
jgi:hypothetical protein